MPRILNGLALLSLFLFLASCGGEKSAESSRQPAPGGGEPVAGGTAVIALGSDPDVLNSLIRRSAAAGQVLDLLQDALPDMGEDLMWHPRIAEDWKIDPDRRAITYRIRPWVWSDGLPLTAHDVVGSFQLFVDPAVASPRRGQYRDVTGAVALDSLTVRYTFARPLPDPVARTFHAVLPGHLVGDLEPAEVMNWDINRHPLSSGPFCLESWEQGRSLQLVPNELYPPGRPYLDRVVFRIIPDPQARVVALETGEVDFVDGITPADARRLEGEPSLRIEPVGGRQYYYLMWNTRLPIFADPLTRHALSLAIDRQRMIATLLLGFGAPAVGPVAPVMWNFNRDLVGDPYDPDTARNWLAEAGWADSDGDGVLERDGHRLRFEMITKLGDPVRENGAVILRENLRDIGAEVTVRVLELATGLELVNDGRFAAYFGSFNANLYGDPTSVVHSRSTDEFNDGHYANARVDSLLDLAAVTYDRAEALTYWHQVQAILLEDQPSAYLFYPEKLVAFSTRLQGVRPHVLSPYNNLGRWWIATSDRKYRSGN